MTYGGIFGTQTPTQWLGNFAEQFFGDKPLFSGGVQIGSWTGQGSWFDGNASDQFANVCNQIVTLNDGVTAAQQDPSTWYTYDDWDQNIRVQDYCLSKGVVPSWMTQAQLATYQQNADGSYSLPGAGSSLVVPLAVAGGLVLLSVILLARR